MRPLHDTSCYDIRFVPKNTLAIRIREHHQHYSTSFLFTHKADFKGQKVDANGFHLGQRVLHPKFGEGMIIDHEGEGERAQIHIKFDFYGSKWLALAYAKLETSF